MWRYSFPLLFFFGLVVLFIFGLQNDPSKVPSPLIDKPAPAFALDTLHNENIKITHDTLKGRVTLLNVWASWCAACRIEHPLLVRVAREGGVAIYGLNYKDKRPNALQWLKQLGDPYVDSAFDQQGDVGIDYGVYGVPETFVLDKQGIIRYKHIGPVEQEDLDNIIMPLVRQLENAS